MLNSYYYICKGIILAPVYAFTKEEADNILVLQHNWIGAAIHDAELLQVVEGTEYDRICSSPPALN